MKQHVVFFAAFVLGAIWSPLVIATNFREPAIRYLVHGASVAFNIDVCGILYVPGKHDGLFVGITVDATCIVPPDANAITVGEHMPTDNRL